MADFNKISKVKKNNALIVLGSLVSHLLCIYHLVFYILLQRIETIKNNNYGFTIGTDKYSRIFGRNELIPLKDFKVNMEVPIIPLNCLCGCSHKLDFTLDKQNKRFENKGNYKCFFNAKHITTFKKQHHF